MSRHLTNLALVAVGVFLIGASVVAHAAHGGLNGTFSGSAAVHASPTPASEPPGKHKAKKSPKPARSHDSDDPGDQHEDQG